VQPFSSSYKVDTTSFQRTLTDFAVLCDVVLNVYFSTRCMQPS